VSEKCIDLIDEIANGERSMFINIVLKKIIMKKSCMIKYGGILLLLFICNSSYAEDSFTVNGITYSLTSTSTVAVNKMDVPDDGHVVFPSSVEYRDRIFIVNQIGANCNGIFNNPETLESIVIPSTIKRITSCGSGIERSFSYIFDKCVNLKKIVIEDSEETLYFPPNKSDGSRGGALFSHCPLEEVYIGRNISYITERVNGKELYYSPFKKQAKLRIVKIGDKVTTLDKGMFSHCKSLKDIDIPQNIQEIPLEAFMNCSSLSNVVLHEGLLKINYHAFYDSPIKSISIPKSVVQLESGCFDGNELTSIIINDNIKEIPDGAFYTSTLKQVVIGSSVEYIGGSVFGNSSLEKIECRMLNPENCSVDTGNYPWAYHEEETFSLGNYTWATLYVPFGCIEKYKKCYPWYSFVNIVEISSSDIEFVDSKKMLIQNEGGKLMIQNLKSGTGVSVYNVYGTLVGSAVCQNGQAIIDTNLQPNDIAIIKIGNEVVKVLIK